MGDWAPFFQIGVQSLPLLVLYLITRTGDLRTKYEAEAWKQRAERAEQQVDRLLPAMESLTNQSKSLTEQTKGLTEQTRMLVDMMRRSMERDEEFDREGREGKRERRGPHASAS